MYPITMIEPQPPVSQSVPPIIIKLVDGKVNFKAMSKSELASFSRALVVKVGDPKESSLLRGGDLFVITTDVNQHAKLFALEDIDGRKVSGQLPKSITGRKG